MLTDGTRIPVRATRAALREACPFSLDERCARGDWPVHDRPMRMTPSEWATLAGILRADASAAIAFAEAPGVRAHWGRTYAELTALAHRVYGGRFQEGLHLSPPVDFMPQPGRPGWYRGLLHEGPWLFETYVQARRRQVKVETASAPGHFLG